MDQQRTQLENGVQEIDAVKRKLQQNVSEVIDLNLTCFPVLALWQVESLFLGKIKLQNCSWRISGRQWLIKVN